MKKSKKLLVFLLATLCVVGTAGVMTGCGFLNEQSSASEEMSISFKDNFPTHLTVNVSVDISQYVAYEKGMSLTLKAEYTDESGAKKSYETFGTSFMPTTLHDVTLTVGVKDTNITIEKTVPVKISAPKVLSSETVIRYRGEEFELDSLKEGLNVLAPNNEFEFKATELTFIGSDEHVDLSGLEKYTLTEAGMYEVKYEVYNAGGSAQGTLLLFSKRILTDNEKGDLSNYGEGITGQSSGRVVVDEVDMAENSDWSYTVWAPSNATGVDVYNYAPNYWTNYGMLELEGGIDLSRYYLEFDVKFSKDSRDLFSIRMVDEAVTIASNEKIIQREGVADENGEYAWQHVSMKDMYKYGTYQYIRFMIMHPLTSDSSSYDANNVWVKFDNVRLCEYDVPYEYHEAVDYVKTEADYIAEDGAFEEGLQLWENMDDNSRATYLAQDGAYTNEVTEFNFTLDSAEIDEYRFVLGARVKEAGSYNEGVYLDFRRDAYGAFFAVYTPIGLNANYYLTAANCYFTSGHNYTVTFGVIDRTLKLIVQDNTSSQIVLEYEYVFAENVTLPENGGFGFWSYKNIIVACKKPHTYIEEVDVAEVTISEFSIGQNNRADYFDLMIGNGTMQKAIVSDSNNIAKADGTFGTTSTWLNWTESTFKFFVGVLANSRTSFQIFPTGYTAQIGDRLSIPEGATIIVDGYTVIFGETFEVWFNGETWQTEYVEAPPVEEKTESISQLTYSSCNAEYKTINLTSVNGTDKYKWSSVKANYNGEEIDATIVWENETTIQIGTGKDWAEGDVFTLKAGSSFTQIDVTFTFAVDYSVYYYDGTWHEEPKPEALEVTISGFSFGTNNRADYFDLIIENGGMQSAILSSGDLTHVEGTFGTTSTWGENMWKFFVGVLASSENSFQIFPTGKTVEAGHKLVVPQGATIIVDGYTVIFGEGLEVWYNGTTWQMEEYVGEQPDPNPDPDPEPEGPTKMTLTELDARSIYADGMYQIYFKVDIINSGATWGGWDNNASVVLNGVETKADGWCFASKSLLYVQVTTDQEANPITIAKGTALKINGMDYEIAEDFNVYYYDGAWQTQIKKECTISNFSFGATNKVDRVDLVIGDGTLPADFVSYGAANNLSYAEGTFGATATWNDSKFKGIVGVLTNGNNGFMIFPSGATAQVNDVLTIPQGATIVANGYTIIFGEEVKLTFDGIMWTMEGVEVQTTKMTISSIASNSVCSDNMYQIYLKTNIDNTGATWANWDNSAEVDLNGMETKADGWCFANNGKNSLLYLQVTTTETPNPITVVKGTILNINGTLYEITEDFHIYYYDGAYHAEPQA